MSLFGTQVSSLACFQEQNALSETGLKAWRMSTDTVMEAKQLVKKGQSLFCVKTGGNENQMILCYMGTPLERVSSCSF